jgi:hypothetical protein
LVAVAAVGNTGADSLGAMVVLSGVKAPLLNAEGSLERGCLAPQYARSCPMVGAPYL